MNQPPLPSQAYPGDVALDRMRWTACAGCHRSFECCPHVAKSEITTRLRWRQGDNASQMLNAHLLHSVDHFLCLNIMSHIALYSSTHRCAGECILWCKWIINMCNNRLDCTNTWKCWYWKFVKLIHKPVINKNIDYIVPKNVTCIVYVVLSMTDVLGPFQAFR